jgi:hypothetical protein
VIKGGEAVFITTLKEHVELLPAGSVAVYVTTVVPSGKVVPGVCVDEVVAEQLSVTTGGTHVPMPSQPLVVMFITVGHPENDGGC